MEGAAPVSWDWFVSTCGEFWFRWVSWREGGKGDVKESRVPCEDPRRGGGNVRICVDDLRSGIVSAMFIGDLLGPSIPGSQ